jgi:hypothetical protein
VSLDEQGVAELLELATPKLLGSRQLDHAFVQFGLAGQLHAWLVHSAASGRGGGAPAAVAEYAGEIYWNQACVLCTAVAVQLRRARAVTTEQLRGCSAAELDGGLVAPRLLPNRPLEDVGRVVEARLAEAVRLLAMAVRATPLAGPWGAPHGTGPTPHGEEKEEEEDEDEEEEEEEEMMMDPWPPTADELRHSEFLEVLRRCCADKFEAFCVACSDTCA